MRLLPGYATSPSLAMSVAVHTPFTQRAVALFVDAVAFEVVPTVTAQARVPTDLIRARNAIELYSAVSRINEPSSASLNVFG